MQCSNSWPNLVIWVSPQSYHRCLVTDFFKSVQFDSDYHQNHPKLQLTSENDTLYNIKALNDVCFLEAEFDRKLELGQCFNLFCSPVWDLFQFGLKWPWNWSNHTVNFGRGKGVTAVFWCCCHFFLRAHLICAFVCNPLHVAAYVSINGLIIN